MCIMADGCRPIKVAVLTIWSILPVIAVPTLTIQPAALTIGSTLTLTCELVGFTTALMNFYKDGTTVYTCGSGGQTCDDNGGLSDYSQVDWSQTDKGIVTLSNADLSRDGGYWTCAVGGGGGTSVAVTLTITGMTATSTTKTTTTTTTTQATALIIALPTVFGSIIVMAAAAFGVIWFRKHYTNKKPNSTVKVKLRHSNRPDGQGRGQNQGD